MGRAISRARRHRRHQRRADLREPRRHDGRQQPASALPDLGDRRRCPTRWPRSWRRRRPIGASTARRCCSTICGSSGRRASGSSSRTSTSPCWCRSGRYGRSRRWCCRAGHVGAIDELTAAESTALAAALSELDHPLRQPVRDVLSLLDGLPPAADRRRGAPGMAAARAFPIRRCCARRRCASSWSASSCSARRSATSRPEAAAARLRALPATHYRDGPECRQPCRIENRSVFRGQRSSRADAASGRRWSPRW